MLSPRDREQLSGELWQLANLVSRIRKRADEVHAYHEFAALKERFAKLTLTDPDDWKAKPDKPKLEVVK